MTMPMQLPRLIRLPEVMAVTGLGRDSIYRLIRQGRFPAQRRLSERASAWRVDEIAAWVESRPAAELPSPKSRSARSGQ
jgi:prophage regulatory protein